MAMTSAFCCTSLKTGTLIVGWLSLILVVLGATVTSVTMASSEHSRNNRSKNGRWDSPDQFQDMMSPNTYYAIYFVATVINIAALICLLCGTNKGRRGLLVPYLTLYGFAASAGIFLILLQFAMGMHWLLLMPRLITLPIAFYCLAIVYSYYKELSPENQLQDPKSQQAQMRQPV